MACTYILKRGASLGTACGKYNCNHNVTSNTLFLININPNIILNKNTYNTYYVDMLPKLGIKNLQIIYNRYNKWIHMYMYMKSIFDGVIYDIFTNLICYYF